MAHAPAVGMARSHLGTAVANPLVVFQSLLDGERWLTLAFEVIRVVFLEYVSDVIRFRRTACDVPVQAIAYNRLLALAEDRPPPRS